MLKQRVISGLVMLALCLWVLLDFNLIEFSVTMAVMSLLMVWEWSRLIGLQSCWRRLLYLLSAAGVMFVFYLLPSLPVLAFAAALWCVLIAVVVRFERKQVSCLIRNPWLSGCIGLLLCSALWVSLSSLFAQPLGRTWLLYSFVVVWAMDVGGYFAGRAYGRRALSPTVSPKKTWEGVFGGLLVLLPFVAVGVWRLHLSGWHAVLLIVVSYAAAIFAVYGDLYESVLKRFAGVKDSGKLLPGHGGVLDRMDGVLAALPVMALSSFFITSLS